jgi:hypothetical protein
LLLDGIGQAVDIRIERGILRDIDGDVGGLLLGRAGQNFDVELGDGDFDAEFGECGNGRVLLVEGGPVETVVALESDGADGDAASF